VSRAAGIPEAKVLGVNRWRDSEVYSPVERLVLEYAECITRTPADVPDELRAALREHLTAAQLVELTTAIAWENFRARFNRGFDVQPQNYADGAACVVPDPGGAPTPPSSARRGPYPTGGRAIPDAADRGTTATDS